MRIVCTFAAYARITAENREFQFSVTTKIQSGICLPCLHHEEHTDLEICRKCIAIATHWCQEQDKSSSSSSSSSICTWLLINVGWSCRLGIYIACCPSGVRVSECMWSVDHCTPAQFIRRQIFNDPNSSNKKKPFAIISSAKTNKFPILGWHICGAFFIMYLIQSICDNKVKNKQQNKLRTPPALVLCVRAGDRGMLMSINKIETVNFTGLRTEIHGSECTFVANLVSNRARATSTKMCSKTNNEAISFRL